MRCKFLIESVKRRANAAGEIEAEEVHARPVYANSPENAKWSKWTPSGTLDLHINNPESFGKLLPGVEVYVDITPIPKDEVAKV